MSDVAGRHLLPEPLASATCPGRRQRRRGIGARAFDRPLDDGARKGLSRRRSKPAADGVLGSIEATEPPMPPTNPPTLPSVPLRGR
jgi:hypothetical protein